MKKILLIFPLFLISILAYCQITDNYWHKLETNPANFMQIVDTFENHIATEYPDSIPVSSLPNITEYQRFVNFWQSRLGLYNGQASYEPYKDAVANTVNSPYCVTGDPSEWELVGPVTYLFQRLGLVRQVLHDPNTPGSYLLASDYGGIWKNQQTGNSWVNVTDNLRTPGLAISELIRDPNNHNHLLASTSSGLLGSGYRAGYGIGIIESFDNGQSWAVMSGLSLQDAKGVKKVLFDPSDNTGNTLYAITYNKIYKSTNLGQTWNVVQGPGIDTYENYQDIEISDNGIIYISTFAMYTNAGSVFRYVNNNWEKTSSINNFGAFQHASISKPYGGKIFVSCFYSNGNNTGIATIHKTVDYGNNWSNIKTINEKEKSGIKYSPQSNIVYFSGVKLFYFKDDGIYKDASFYTLHADVRDIDFLGIDQNGMEDILIANDGGISKASIDIQSLTHQNLTNLNGNYLPICEFVGFGISHSSSEFIVAGAMHNQSYKYLNGIWSNFASADGGDCEVNWDDPSYYYYMDPYSGQHGTHGFNYNSSSSKSFVGMEYELNPNNPYKIYFGRARKNDYSKAVLGIYNAKNSSGTITKDVPYGIKAVGAIAVNADNDICVADFKISNENDPNRLVKSSDEGNSWSDYSNSTVHYNGGQSTLKNIIAWKSIEDIIFNPNNSNEMWISIGGVNTSNGAPEEGKLRVLHSTNGGNSWYDYSEGLSAFPVMALVYQAGSDNRLFAGTDAGVFYRDPTMNKWKCFSHDLPTSIITELNYNPCNGYLYASAYGRSLYKTYVPLDDKLKTIISDSIAVWNNPKELVTNLVIKTGTTLTITDNVYISKGRYIIIEPGAKLILDGCTLTNGCGESWQGIQVYGNPNASQYPDANGNYAQGVLIMKNGATIENAVNAVALQNSDQWGHEGGIIYASDAHFINNRRSVEFMPYQNHFPPTGEACDNLSRFTNCEFVYNDNYNIPTGMRTHVTMWEVNGVKFNGCTFINDIDNEPNTGYGIYTIDAGYRVNSYCNAQLSPCPAQDVVRSAFKGLNTGVYSANSMYNNKLISILNSNFKNNGTGVYLGYTYGSVIVNDTFEIGAIDDACNNKVGIGIQLNNSKMFAVEQNHFQTFPGAPPAQFIGIRVANTNNESDEIYKNSYDGLDVSIQAEGKNWWRHEETGLAYYCNDNQSNDYDFYVKRIDDIDGIQRLQGSGTMVAGNIFSTNVKPKGNFYNESAYTIDYHYAQNGQNEYPAERENVDVFPKQLSKVCPSHYGDGGHDIRLSSAGYQQRETDYNTATASYTNAVSQYDAANDTATRDYWADKMSYYNIERARAAYDIICSDLADTIAHPDLFKTWMEKLDTYSSNEALVDYYLQQGDYTMALNKVDSLPYFFTFTAYDSIEYPMYKDYKHMQAIWLNDGRTIFDLTDTEINNLIAIADSSKGTAGAQARAILQFAYPSQYSDTDCIGKPGGTIKSARLNNGSASENSELTVSVKPNPVSTSVSFSYTLPKDHSTGTVELYDNSGKKVNSVSVNNNGTKTLDCSGLSSGIYLYRFTSGSSVKTGKFVIQH